MQALNDVGEIVVILGAVSLPFAWLFIRHRYSQPNKWDALDAELKEHRREMKRLGQELRNLNARLGEVGEDAATSRFILVKAVEDRGSRLPE